MAERKSREEMNAIKEKYSAMNTWSWSRYNSSLTDLYGYLLHYILHIDEDQISSIYGSLGGCVHELLEQLHEGTITREEAIEKYKDTAMELEILGQAFSRTDENQNDNIGRKYHLSNLHFLENYVLREGENAKLEEFITINISKQLFIGYVDYMYEKDGFLQIEDFKTSSIYTGEKILKEEGQLLLYSLGMIQQGWDIDKLKVGWLFTKYCTAKIQMKNQSVRSSNIMRWELGSKLRASAKGWLTDKKAPVKYSDIEVDAFLDELVEANDIKVLPTHIQEKFEISDCFVEIEVTQEKLDALVEKMKKQIFKLVKLEMEYKKTKDDNLFWVDITDSDSYFFQNLCGYSRRLHKPYDEFLKNKDSLYNKPKEDEIDIDQLMRDLDIG